MYLFDTLCSINQNHIFQFEQALLRKLLKHCMSPYSFPRKTKFMERAGVSHVKVGQLCENL